MSNYIGNSLGKGEKVVKRAQFNGLFLLGKWILGVLFCWLLFIPTIKAIAETVKFKNVELGFTNKRVVGKRGVFNTRTLDAPLNKIQNMTVTQTFFGQIFNYSTVRIDTAAGSFYFEAVKDADHFKRLLMNEIDKYEEELVKQQAMQMANAMSAALKQE